MGGTQNNGGHQVTQGRPREEDASPAGREAKVREIFRAQRPLLEALFVKDGKALVARCLQSAIAALKMRDKKTGALMLEKISPEQIAEKCIACHAMGLEPITEAYLIAYGTDLQIIRSPQGLIKLMANAGWRVEARAVREGDFFEHDLGDEGFIKHRKPFGQNGRRETPISGAYAFAKHVDGGPTIREVLSWDDLEAYRSQSKQANGPMWTDNYEGAARKTAIHRLAELIPLPAEARTGFRQNDVGGIEIPEEIMVAVRNRLIAEVRADIGLTAPSQPSPKDSYPTPEDAAMDAQAFAGDAS